MQQLRPLEEIQQPRGAGIESTLDHSWHRCTSQGEERAAACPKACFVVMSIDWPAKALCSITPDSSSTPKESLVRVSAVQLLRQQVYSMLQKCLHDP